jgi:Fe-S cluster biogenesis protein NfuA
MQDSKDFQTKVQRIADLVAGLEQIEDAEARTSAKALVQLLLDLHAVGIERALEIVAKDDVSGQRTIDDLGRDPVVSSRLVLYNLHPMPRETRIEQAVEKVRPHVRKGGGEVKLLGIDAGVVRLNVQVVGHVCGSTKSTIKSMVEDALYEAAPDLAGLQIAGIEDAAGSAGFVPLGKLGGAIAEAPVMSAS